MVSKPETQSQISTYVGLLPCIPVLSLGKYQRPLNLLFAGSGDGQKMQKYGTVGWLWLVFLPFY
jgi:hypothetical protein